MSSVREQILTAIITALNGATTVGYNIFRERETPLSREMTPAIVVTPAEEQDQLQSDAINESTFAVEVSVYVRGDPMDQVADPIAIAMHPIIMTNAGIAALAHQVRKMGSKWETHEADQTAGVLTMTYHFRYLHPINDITRTM